jgi:predicted nuclease of predicted toxin-antitoxin system
LSLRLYMDVHVPPNNHGGTAASRRDVLRAQEDGAERLEDADLLDRASALQRVLFTQDDDFLAECARRQSNSIPFFGLIYAHQMRTTIGRCVQDLELVAKVYEPSDMAGRIEHLPLR